MSRQDDIAAKAVRKSTLKSIKEKKQVRLRQLKEDYEKSVQEIHIQYSEDPERLKAKYAAENYAKNERKQKIAAKRIETEKKLIEAEKKVRHLTVGEEIASSIVQGLGACLFIAGTAILDTIAISKAQEYITTTIIFYSLFGVSMILMYLFSLLQHALTNFTANQKISLKPFLIVWLISGLS